MCGRGKNSSRYDLVFIKDVVVVQYLEQDSAVALLEPTTGPEKEAHMGAASAVEQTALDGPGADSSCSPADDDTVDWVGNSWTRGR